MSESGNRGIGESGNLHLWTQHSNIKHRCVTDGGAEVRFLLVFCKGRFLKTEPWLRREKGGRLVFFFCVAESGM